MGDDKLKVRKETQIIMKALDKVLKREDVMNRKVDYTFPEGHPKAGQEVKAPVWSFVKGILEKMSKKKIAKKVDENVRQYGFIINPFLEELAEILVENGYYTGTPPESHSVTKTDEEKLRKTVEGEKTEEDEVSTE